MHPIPSGSDRRRPHPDSLTETQASSEEARRVRARSTPHAEESRPDLSLRAASISDPSTASPRQPSVSRTQLEQWRSAARRRGDRAAEPGTWAARVEIAANRAPAPAMPLGAAAQRNTAEASGVPDEGSNTLVVYAMQGKLMADGVPARRLPACRSALARFGDALLRRNPPVTLQNFMDRLWSDDPTERLSAAALKESTVRELHFSGPSARHLETALRALFELPREQRRLTLGQALLAKLQAPAMRTLLPESDRLLLQQVQDLDSGLGAVAAGTQQVLLIRMGIALMAEGRGGLAAWLSIYNEQDGYRQAMAQLERLKGSPALGLTDFNKHRLGAAAARLQACGLGLAQALSHQEVGASRPASLALRFPRDFPADDRDLIDTRLQAGLDGRLSRATLSNYGRELIGLSEWLRKYPDAHRPAHPLRLRTLIEMSQDGRQGELLDLTNAFIASRPASSKARPALQLLLDPPASTPSGLPMQEGAPVSADMPAPRDEPISSPQPRHGHSWAAWTHPAQAWTAEAGPSRIAASPAEPSRSPGSLSERMENADIEHLLHELDDVMSAYQPSASAIPAVTVDTHALVRNEGTQALLRSIADSMARALPEEPSEEPPEFEAMLGEFTAAIGAGTPGDAGSVIDNLTPQAAVNWFVCRLQDVQMILHLPRAPRAEAMRFARHLASREGALEGLSGFLQRYEGSDPALRRDARIEMARYLGPQGRSILPGSRTDPLVSALERLAAIPPAQRDWNDPSRRLRLEQVNSKYRPWLLPPQDLVSMERLTRAQRDNLSRFARDMLGAGHGGLANWLTLFHSGQGRLARRLMLDFVKANPNISRKGSLSLAGDRIQAMSGTRSGLRLAVQGTGRTTIGAVPKRPSQQAPALPVASGSVASGKPAKLPQEASRTPAPSFETRLRSSALMTAGQSGVQLSTAAAELEAVQWTGIPLEGANTLMAYALADLLLAEGKSVSTMLNVRNALKSFGEGLLLQTPPLSLAGFLERRGSPDTVQRADANTRQAAIVQGWHADKRNNALSALRKLDGMPPSQRMWSIDHALRSKMQAPAMRTLLSAPDQHLIDKVGQHAAGQVSGTTSGRDQIMLIRFGIALMAQGRAGLSHWLEMHDDAQDHANAKELLERFLADPLLASPARKSFFLAAVKRLHEVALTPETELLHPQLRTPADAAAPVVVRFPGDFPRAEAELINARLEVGKALGLSRRTLENYGRDLLRLSEWLRKPDDAASSVRSPPDGQTLVSLTESADDAVLQAIRGAFFGQGKPGNAPSALDLLVGRRLG